MKHLKKIGKGIINYIDENIKELLFILGIYVVLTYQLPYYILVSGGTIEVDDRVEITEEYNQEGSFNLAYVDQINATLPTYLLSKVIKSWTVYNVSDYTYDSEEDQKEVDLRDSMELNNSMQSAVKVAYLEAGKDFIINEYHHYIYYVDESIKNSGLVVGDEIISINDKEFSDLDEFREEIENKDIGDIITLKYKRNKKVKEVELKIKEENNRKIVGLMIMTLYDYETDPEISFKFNKKEGGSSGGLTLALAIYNKLVEEDITHGYTIVGTGTINDDGSVGEIGGVKYKLKGAIKKKADIFIVPNGTNYKEAKEEAEKHNYKIDIIGVNNFTDAINKLKNYKK